MTTFGESAPAGDLMKFFGFTVDNVVKKVKELLSNVSHQTSSALKVTKFTDRCIIFNSFYK